jgi:hypothetical protein
MDPPGMLDNHDTGVVYLQHDVAAALKWHDVTRWSHSQKQIRGGLDDAAAAGFKVDPTTAHGHSWGYIDCPNCAGRFYVWSTPASADRHARQIRRSSSGTATQMGGHD